VLKTALALLLLTATTWADPFQEHLVKLIKAHGEKHIVQDSRGVGVKGQSARLQASLCDAQYNLLGFNWTVQMEIKVHLSNGELSEFVTGVGNTREEATTICLSNFTRSTFHVLYKAFLNPNDKHLQSVSFGPKGHPRQLVAGELLLMGGPSAPAIPVGLESQVVSIIKRHSFSAGPHTVKIVFMPGEASSVAIDGQEQTSLAEALTKLKWPKSNQTYMMKQFIVVK
jgi:hypothetical protein